MKNLILLILFFGNVQAQNLLANNSFDSDISSWNTLGNTVQWIANDGAATSGNGCIELRTALNNGGWIRIESEKVPVVQNYHYILGISYKRPTGSLSPYGYLSIYWFDQNDNFVGEYPHLGVKPVLPITDDDQWLNDISEWDNIVTDAVKASVILWVPSADSGTNDAVLRYDDVIFYQDTVFVSGFD